MGLDVMLSSSAAQVKDKGLLDRMRAAVVSRMRRSASAYTNALIICGPGVREAVRR
jgi:hypothetical protein